jgi:HAD superfamily hydrolase (TIGR01509 family)
MLRGVIFDMDGVIVDSHPVHIASWKTFLASVGVAASDKELDIVRDGRSKEEILQHFICDLSREQVCGYGDEKDRIYREHAQNLTAVAGLHHLLEELRAAGIPLAVASSGSFWRVQHTLDFLQVRNYFGIVSTADEFKSGKSDSRIFLNTAQRMQIRCDESLLFDDSATAIRSATAIGMKCFGITDSRRAETLVEAGAEQVFPDFLDISLSKLHALFSLAHSKPVSRPVNLAV